MIGHWLAPLILALPSPGPPDWVAVKALDGTFSAEMPAEPKVLDRDVEMPPDVLRQTVYHARAGGAFYSIQAIARPAPIPREALGGALDADFKAYVEGSGGKVVREGRTAIDGIPARDVTLSGPAPGGKAGVVASRVRIALADRTSYVVTVMGPIDGPLPSDAGRFFDAFHLTLNGPKATATIADATPEEALRSFLAALMAQDGPSLRAVALPAAEFERLLAGPKPSAAQRIAIGVSLKSIAIRPLKPGDEVTLPGGKKVVVEPEEVAEDRAVLVAEGNPIPTRLRKIAGHWRVDPRPVIAGRKAAEAARARAKARAKAEPEAR